VAKITLERLQRIAKKKKGRCASSSYEGANEPMKWECQYGHSWKTSAVSILYRGKWCAICSLKKKNRKDKKTGYRSCGSTKLITLERLQTIATKRGGICLSKTYRNSGVKLKWQCSKGHKWQAIAANILYRGTWCPVCARNIAAKKRRVFDKSGREKIVHMYVKQKMTVLEIATKLKVNDNTVYQVLKEENVKMRPVEPKPSDVKLEKEVVCLYEQGYSGLQIERETGINYRRVYRILHNNSVRIRPTSCNHFVNFNML